MLLSAFHELAGSALTAKSVEDLHALSSKVCEVLGFQLFHLRHTAPHVFHQTTDRHHQRVSKRVVAPLQNLRLHEGRSHRYPLHKATNASCLERHQIGPSRFRTACLQTHGRSPRIRVNKSRELSRMLVLQYGETASRASTFSLGSATVRRKMQLRACHRMCARLEQMKKRRRPKLGSMRLV
jgi:hypothetical protein